MIMSDSDVIDMTVDSNNLICEYLIKPYFDFSFYHVSSYRNSYR